MFLLILKVFLPMSMLHHGLMICFSYSALHDEILKLKQIFQGNSNPNFFYWCIKTHLDKMFTEFTSFVPCLKKNWLVIPIFCEKVVRIQNFYFKFNGKNITLL